MKDAQQLSCLTLGRPNGLAYCDNGSKTELGCKVPPLATASLVPSSDELLNTPLVSAIINDRSQTATGSYDTIVCYNRRADLLTLYCAM